MGLKIYHRHPYIVVNGMSACLGRQSTIWHHVEFWVNMESVKLGRDNNVRIFNIKT